jgi:rubrerythrin
VSTDRELLTEALQTALQMEKDGYSFYDRAAERTQSKQGKLVFRYVMQEELEHMRRITQEHEALVTTGQWQAPGEQTGSIGPGKAPSIFPKSEAEIEARVSTHADDLEALKLAIKIETDGIKFYSETAGKTTDPLGKSFFKWLAGQEKEHRKIFEDYYDYLENPSYWFQLHNNPIIEG